MQRRRLMALLALSAASGGLLSACSRSDDSAGGPAPAGLSADEAKEYGLVDQVIAKRP